MITIIGDLKITTALLDRRMHHCHIAEAGNQSTQFSRSTSSVKTLIKARELARNGVSTQVALCWFPRG